MAPRWASINLGIFLCVQCASIHRSLGTHTSRVKSLTMDTWTREMVEHMRVWGNIKANEVWNPDERRNPVPVSVGEEGRQGEMERYIRNKYERGLFRGDRSEVDGAVKVKETRAFGNGVGGGRQDGPRRPSLEEIYDEPRRHNEYAYEPVSLSKKKKATRAHVDANWADFIDGTTPSEEYEDRPTSSGSRKAGRLLGMVDGDRGAVRLPPVTKAPKGLVYRREGEEGRAPPVPSKTKSPEPVSQPPPQSQSRPQLKSTPTVTPDLVNLNDSIHVPAPYQVASIANGPAPPMQRMFHQPQPMPSPLPVAYNTYNPFLNPTFQQPPSITGYQNPPSANGTTYPNPMQGPPAFPFQQQQHLQSPFYSPGPASAGGYFASSQQQVQTGNPFFAQQQQQGTGYGGWSR